ncbi:CPBP family intramembrane metalloprotease [bacterium]|nr:CPBP family intramembrane metalloprotease [bacterium]
MTESTTSYWAETRRPMVNLAFVLPLLIAYEWGVWWMQQQHLSARNGADEWLRSMLASASGSLAWCLPVLLIGIFVAWHHVLREPAQVKVDTLAGMAAESLLFACLLVLLGQAADSWMRASPDALLQVQETTTNWVGVRLIHFLGAGLYEEFLFRLCLIPASYLLLRLLLVPARWSTWGAILLSSCGFALAHYLTPTTDATLLAMISEAVTRVQSSRELWFGFTFRLLAGVLFALIFAWRGFGIAVGCHAAYDIVVGIILVTEL